ncbi:hypothetical protein [Sphingobacterium bambusae]|uniref:Uncharacterized protein n=1 Tax=Sphingobacterium bambusae TaxID=662858 RepID=A0ABW6BI81_9SPHI|nr:hypothetical protein [Sphingobacterium bambusae]WPL48951.1 hypothetical protein SCB77_00550 [Sphingobacterium bambusae]
MYWELDGHHIEVRLRESGTIEILRWDEDAKIVYLPAGLSQAEAMWSIRNLLQEKIKSAPHVPPLQLHVFGRHWALVPQWTSKSCYIKNGAIYVHASRFKSGTRQLHVLEQELLRQKVIELMGKWEDFFSCILPDATFRKNEHRPFSVSIANKKITFDKGLLRFSMEQIEYCVFRACCIYLSVEPKTMDAVIHQRFPSAKLFEKIFQHEYKRYS